MKILGSTYAVNIVVIELIVDLEKQGSALSIRFDLGLHRLVEPHRPTPTRLADITTQIFNARSNAVIALAAAYCGPLAINNPRRNSIILPG